MVNAFDHDLIYLNDLFFPHACQETVQQITMTHMKRDRVECVSVEVLCILGSVWDYNVRFSSPSTCFLMLRVHSSILWFSIGSFLTKKR